MAVIANSVAAPGQWTPSLLKSGKPRALSMLEAVTATSSSEACPRTRSGGGDRFAQGKRINPKRLAGF
jgi:hypothetical protein